MTFDNEADFMAPGRPRATLIVKQGPQIGIHFSITADNLILGREETCEITIQDAEVSRRHSQISWEEDTYVLNDVGSTNGTFLNGMQISSPTPLKNGDSVGLGQTTLILEIEEAILSATPEYIPPTQSSKKTTDEFQQQSSLGTTQKWLLFSFGCLLLLCVSSIAIPAILHLAGLINLTEFLQTVLQWIGFS